MWFILFIHVLIYTFQVIKFEQYNGKIKIFYNAQIYSYLYRLTIFSCDKNKTKI
jgi:hypothetical protein